MVPVLPAAGKGERSVRGFCTFLAFLPNSEKSGPPKDRLYTHTGTSKRLRPVGRNERILLVQCSVDPGRMALPFLMGFMQSLRNLRGMAPELEAVWGLDCRRMTC